MRPLLGLCIVVFGVELLYRWSEQQGGFRTGRSTVQQIFILRSIQAAEWQAILYITFMDFEKAFDSVS